MSSMVIFILGSVIAERGIADHYSGKGFVTESVGYAMPDGRSSRGKIVCTINVNIALRKSFLPSRLAGSMQCREWQEEVVGNMGSREFGATVIYYAYMIHTKIGNKKVAAKVFFFTFLTVDLLFLDMYANAEVVEIIIYNVSLDSSFFLSLSFELRYWFLSSD
ncbi:hypothetical protein LOK49_LG04G00238 [Camellia lanceoleosa]|uniref:Uncharacterized protein n=1 Tax=Camellia lanceoleosa TaxID=1840588 RepID=A0ACC0I4M8_9ERIC|nr:hypothetical protein LOK49_LG04G00238 [Camellia lanceoleosa]